MFDNSGKPDSCLAEAPISSFLFPPTDTNRLELMAQLMTLRKQTSAWYPKLKFGPTIKLTGLRSQEGHFLLVRARTGALAGAREKEDRVQSHT